MIYLPFLCCSRGIVFVVDSAIFQKEVRDVAEFLYVLLTDAVIARNAPALIVACNKQGNSAPSPCPIIIIIHYSQVCLPCRCHNGKICKADPAAAGKGIVSDVSPFISVQKHQNSLCGGRETFGICLEISVLRPLLGTPCG